ncbi:MAG: SPOR domain-containing protein [Vibrio sp.]
MKKIAIISLSVIALAACSSSYDSEVSTQTYEENYQTDQIPQPMTETNGSLEQDITPAAATTATTSSTTPAVTDDSGLASGRYVIQIASMENEQYLLTTASKLPSDLPKWENVKTLNGTQLHTLLVGDFASADEARASLSRVPATFSGAFIKSVDTIRASEFPTIKKLP